MTNNRHQHPPQPVTALIMSSIFQFQSQAQRPGQTLPDKVGRGYIYIATHHPGWHRGSQQIQAKDQICLFSLRARKPMAQGHFQTAEECILLAWRATDFLIHGLHPVHQTDSSQ